MTKTPCTVEEVDLDTEAGYTVEGVCVTCTRCQHQTEAFGTGEASIKRCLVKLRAECPRDEFNYYEVMDHDATN